MSLHPPNSMRLKDGWTARPTLSRRSSLGSDIFGPLSRRNTSHSQSIDFLDVGSRTPQRSTGTPASTIAPSSVDLNPPARPEDIDLGSFIVISGGTGCNAICEAFGKDASYVLPVSDNGGSSSEGVGNKGGPSIGDIRSRLIRLIPAGPPPAAAIKNLLSYRFPSDCSEREAREFWRDIVEGKSKIWAGIPPDRKETIRVYFESELLKRAHKNFDFRNGSLGNYFLAAAQGFFRSLPSAIFLFSSITHSQAHVLPVLVTSHFVTIAAELTNKRTIVGQCEISHPVPSTKPSALAGASTPQSELESEETPGEGEEDDDDDEHGGGAADTSRLNAMFSKAPEGEGSAAYAKLEARINRVFYINAYGQEIFPSPNSDFIENLGKRKTLMRSIIPCLALRGVASAIAKSASIQAKVLLLNGQNDRETEGYSAEDYVNAIARVLNRHDRLSHKALKGTQTPDFLIRDYPVSAFITHVIYLRGSSIRVDQGKLAAAGVHCVEVEGPSGDKPLYDPATVRWALDQVYRRDIH
ncbi:hypothetical protein RHS04_03994 [Rhizoctonia solani]|uniref:Uncharacterized protein n=1 Tax=Rhizoctonia solani TaxID=456999 RepID=A0A8H7H8E5_9AGAM|nr:hypothetical protein RHS04_03994 [Rhizoctonia solani]